MRGRLLLPALATLVAATAAGCGGGGGNTAGSLAIAIGAAKNSLTQTTLGRSTLTGSTAFGTTSQVFTIGVYDVASKFTFSRVDLPGAGKNASARQDHLVITSSTLYLDPAETTALPKGKLWLSVPLASPAATSGRTGRFVAQAAATDPQLLVGEVAWGAVSAQRRGSSVVVHVPLDRYEVKVDLARALAGASGPLAAAARISIRHQLGALGGKGEVDVTILVDADGRIAQLQGRAPGLGLGAISTTMSYGVKVGSPSLPPAAQVVPLASVLNSAAWTAASPWRFASS